MITLDAVCAAIAGARAEDVRGWVARAWVRPVERGGEYLFEDIDVARVRLIVTLRQDMQVEEGTLPMVLSLLDQLHDLRRDMAALERALRDNVGDDQLATIRLALRSRRDS